jgi:hypothetical protein
MPDGKRAADRLAKQRKKAWDGLTTALNCGDKDLAWAERSKVLSLYTWPQLFRTDESNMQERRKLLERAEQVLGAPDWPWHQSFAVAYDYVKQRVLCNPKTGDYVHSVGYAASVNEVFDSLLASARTAEAPDRVDAAARRTFPMRTEKFGEQDAETDAGWWAWKCFQWTTEKARLHLWIRVEDYTRPCTEDITDKPGGNLLSWASPDTAVAGCTDMVEAWKALVDQHEHARKTAEGLLQTLKTQDQGKLFVPHQTSERRRFTGEDKSHAVKQPADDEGHAYPPTPEDDVPYMAPSSWEIQQHIARSKEMEMHQPQHLHAQAQQMSPHMPPMQQQQPQMVGVPIFVPMMCYPGQHPTPHQSPYVPPMRAAPGEQYPAFPQMPPPEHRMPNRRSSGHSWKDASPKGSWKEASPGGSWKEASPGGLSPNIDSSVVDRIKEDRLSLCDSMSTTSGWVEGESSLGDSGGSTDYRRL